MTVRVSAPTAKGTCLQSCREISLMAQKNNALLQLKESSVWNYIDNYK